MGIKNNLPVDKDAYDANFDTIFKAPKKKSRTGKIIWNPILDKAVEAKFDKDAKLNCPKCHCILTKDTMYGDDGYMKCVNCKTVVGVI